MLRILLLLRKLCEFKFLLTSSCRSISSVHSIISSCHHHFVHITHTLRCLTSSTHTSPILSHHDQPQHYHALRKVPQRNFSPPAHYDSHVAALVAILASPVIILQRSVRSRTHTTLRVKLSDSRTRSFTSYSHASK